MRINKYIALATGMSRRVADATIADKRVRINQKIAEPGKDVQAGDHIYLDDKLLSLPQTTTILMNKPVGYVCSRDGQGSKTIYDLLPAGLHYLKPVGRLDKDTSGLLLLTNDGQLAHLLTHPSFEKQKIYEVVLDKKLSDQDKQAIEHGVMLDDGPSKFKLRTKDNKLWTITMTEGRNRQIRRTFDALDYQVKKLHRTTFDDYRLGSVTTGSYKEL